MAVTAVPGTVTQRAVLNGFVAEGDTRKLSLGDQLLNVLKTSQECQFASLEYTHYLYRSY